MGYYDKEKLIRIFNDTKSQCKNKPLSEAIAASAEKQRIFSCSEKIICKKNIFDKDAKIIVSKNRSLDAASKYTGKKVAVLNFASACMPGGGVKQGSAAQEESICRCSTLLFCLDRDEIWQEFYLRHRKNPNPLHNDDIVYTPDVTVFKTDTMYPVTMDKKAWYNVNVISCAAPNLRKIPSNRYNPFEGSVPACIGDAELKALHESRARRILDVAIAGGNQIVILGAFGCGAFQNNPVIVAEAYRKVIGEYRKAFEVIEFAIPAKPDDMNFSCFSRIMKNS